MVTTLPVRINFRLPDGWQAAPPDEVGEPDMAFVALHRGSGANITIDGALRPVTTPLAETADEAVAALQRVCAVQVVQRRELGTPGRPGLTQVLKLVTDPDGTGTRLVQTQVFLSFPDGYGDRSRAVVRFAVTTSPDRFEQPIQGFREFLRTVRLVDPAPPPAGGGGPEFHIDSPDRWTGRADLRAGLDSRRDRGDGQVS